MPLGFSNPFEEVLHRLLLSKFSLLKKGLDCFPLICYELFGFEPLLIVSPFREDEFLSFSMILSFTL